MPGDRRLVFQEAIDRVQSAIDRLLSSDETMRILHNDLHQWNVRYYRGTLSPIDFEDLLLGYPVQDIATTLYYFLSLPEYPEYCSALMRGYTQVIPSPERQPGEIDTFIAARGLGLANFILNDPNPSWKIQAADFLKTTEKRLHRLLKAVHG